MGDVKARTSGKWIDNVFYSDILCEKYLDNIAKIEMRNMSEEEKFTDTYPCDTERG